MTISQTDLTMVLITGGDLMNSSIIKKLFYILAVLTMGCLPACTTTTTKPLEEPPIFYHDGVKIPKGIVRNAWFEHLAENNIGLYSATIRAIIASKKLNKEVFVGKKQIIDGVNLRYEYYLSSKNPNGENILSVVWLEREIKFDHYNDSDGKPMRFFADQYIVQRKTTRLHKELNLGDFN